MHATDKRFIVDTREHAPHVETVDIIPKRDMGVNEVRVGKGSNTQCSMRRDHQSSGCQITVSSKDDGIKHGFKQKTITHPFRHDDIDLRNGQSDFFNLATDASESQSVSNKALANEY